MLQAPVFAENTFRAFDESEQYNSETEDGAGAVLGAGLEPEQEAHGGEAAGEQPLEPPPLSPLPTLHRHGVRSEHDPVFTIFMFTFNDVDFS